MSVDRDPSAMTDGASAMSVDRDPSAMTDGASSPTEKPSTTVDLARAGDPPGAWDPAGAAHAAGAAESVRAADRLGAGDPAGAADAAGAADPAGAAHAAGAADTAGAAHAAGAAESVRAADPPGAGDPAGGGDPPGAGGPSRAADPAGAADPPGAGDLTRAADPAPIARQAAIARPAPIAEGERVILGHGSGGQLSNALIRDVLGPALAEAAPGGPLNDAAVVDVAGSRVAFTTDSFVVSPIRFPGGDIGELAVNGTINDLAMMGAQPLAISLAYVIEEGLPLRDLADITASAARAAARAGTRIVTGDTKVVGRGAADRIFVNTAGIGIVPEGVGPSAERARPGDAVILSGPIGLHGVAIMSVREGLEFEVEIASDTQALNGLVAAMLAVEPGLRVLRDPTRGGLSSALNEIAATSGVGMVLDEAAIPIPGPVRAACEMLGFDPFHVANEGKLVAIAPAASADAVVTAMRALPEGADAARIGEVVAEHPGMVAIRTLVGSERIVDMLVGEQLPRIC